MLTICAGKVSNMRFIIDKVEQQEHMTLVMGKTSIGTIKGIWKYAEPPIISNNYHIELSIAYSCEVDISQEIQCVPFVYIDNDKVVFKGICEDIDEDVYYLRFDIDWLEILDVNTIATKKQIGDYISFSASIYCIEIYPYTL